MPTGKSRCSEHLASTNEVAQPFCTVEVLEPRVLFSSAPSIIIPADAEVLNVLDYGAVADDGLDDTAAIQAALNAYDSGHRIIYLPDGTYHVSDTLEWPDETGIEGLRQKQTYLQGESTSGTVIQLFNTAMGFTDPLAGKAVINTGSGPAQRFGNAIRDLTVDTGVGNDGAIGIQFMANNEGVLSNVDIRSGDGSGLIGLDMGFSSEVGPLLVKNIVVDGFDRGISTASNENSQTFENVTLTDQNVYGWYNRSQTVNVRNLTSTNAVTAIYNDWNGGQFNVVGATLIGTGAASSEAAIVTENNSHAFLRDVTVEGYGRSVDLIDKEFNESSPERLAFSIEDSYIDEWSDMGVTEVFAESRDQTLGLTVLETPKVPYDTNPANYANVEDFGATRGDFTDDTAAFQAAIDSGATTVYLPSKGDANNRSFTIDGTLYIRGNVERIVGYQGTIRGSGTIKFVDAVGAPDTVILERITVDEGFIAWEVDTARTVVISAAGVGGGGLTHTGSGDLFLENVVAAPVAFSGGRVFARQLNVENPGLKITNDGADVWIFGLKTEQRGTVIKTINGGRTELLGAFIFTTNVDSDHMFVVEDSQLSVAGLREWAPTFNPFENILSETRLGENRTLTNSSPFGVFLGHLSAGAEQLSFGAYPEVIGNDVTRIEAEDYDRGGPGVSFSDTTSGNIGSTYRFDDVDVANTTDDGVAAVAIGFTAAGEFTEYSVDTPAGTYDLSFRVANGAATPDGIRVFVDMEDAGMVTVPTTSGFGDYTTVTLADVVIPQDGSSLIRLEYLGANINFNWFELKATSLNDAPFIDTFATTRIEPELYERAADNNTGNQGNAGAVFPGDVDLDYTSDVGGGANLTFIDNGEYVEKSVNVAPGTYDLGFRISSLGQFVPANAAITVLLDGTPIAVLDNIPDTGGFNNWQTVVINDVEITSGGWKDLRIAFDGFAYNLNWIEFTPATLNTPVRLQAETYDVQSGTQLVSGGTVVGWIDDGDYIGFNGVDLGQPKNEVLVRWASDSEVGGGTVDVRLGSPTGTVAGTFQLGDTDNWADYQEKVVSLDQLVSGVQDIYFVFVGPPTSAQGLFSIDWIEFTNNAPRLLEAEEFDSQAGGVGTVNGNTSAGPITDGDYISFTGVDLGLIKTEIKVKWSTRTGLDPEVAVGFEIRLGSPTGTLVDTIDLYQSGNWSVEVEDTFTLSTPVSGTRDLYLVFFGEEFDTLHLNFIEFA